MGREDLTVSPAATAGEPPASVADGRDHALDPRVVATWRIGSAISATVFSVMTLVAMLIVAFGTPLPEWVRFVLAPGGWIALVLLLAFGAVFWPGVRYRHVSYRVSADGIEIRHGVVWRTTIHVPKTRVQHTDVSRGPIERAFGLATLVVYTAGTEHASVSLGGLEHERALRIRDHLIPGGGDDAV